MWIVRYELSNSQKSFFGLAKKLGSYASQAYMCMKKMFKMVVLLWIHYSRHVGYMLEIF